MMSQDNGDVHAVIEAPRDVIEYLNRGKLIHAFDRVGFCIYHGAIVCETGKKDAVIQQLEWSNTLTPDLLRDRLKK